jgi:hypothetical protein
MLAVEDQNVSEHQALRDLQDLVLRGILVRKGARAAAHYVLAMASREAA